MPFGFRPPARRARQVLIAGVALPALFSLAACAFLQQPKFGAIPEGERLATLQRSPNHADGEFRNLVDTPVLVDGAGSFSTLVAYLFQPTGNLRPASPPPTVKTNLKALDTRRDTVVWLGHSSYFVLFAGKRILIDPVLSPYASPVSFSTQAFAGTTLYGVDDLPDIDVLLITHDHWDHLDHATVSALQGKVGRAIVPLGVGAHLERWGYTAGQISEADWYDTRELDGGLAIHVVPARHYSGRWLTRDRALWAGFVLASPRARILFSGDTGYGPHFKDLAQRFGGFDLAALDMGQYDARWPYIHMTPEEAAQAAADLHAQALLPAHVGRFNIALHAWDDPFARIVAASRERPYRLATPMIGEPLIVNETAQRFSRWWENDAAASRLAAIPAQAQEQP